MSLHSEVKLVIIDTLSKFRSLKKKTSNVYYDDYDVLTQMKKLADKYSIALMLIHHTNKLKSRKNVFDRVSGSEGMKGAPDTVGVFMRQRDKQYANLLIRGRDIDEKDITLQKKADVKAWIAIAEKTESDDDPCITGPRKAILSALVNKRLKPHEIASSINKSNGSVRVLLMKLIDQKLVQKDEQGFYFLSDGAHN